GYRGADPDGYMTMPEVIDYLERYAIGSAAPIEERTTVISVRRDGEHYRVTTDRGEFRARSVVIATGHCDIPHVPSFAARAGRDFAQLVPSRYRGPDRLERGGVLIVGASSSGIQLADELHRSGRPVTLAVGRHIRMP